MLTLAIDSTAATATCALSRDGRLVALDTVDGRLTHSEILLPMIERMLADSALTIADVDMFACATGPGSFTGVRIGAAMIKGLAFGSGKPCVGVSTLEALACNLTPLKGQSGARDETKHDPLVVPVMDARRGQVYTAIFRSGERLMEDSLIKLDELRERLTAYDCGICFCGDGYDAAVSYFAGDCRVLKTPTLLIPHNAYSVAQVAERVYEDAAVKTQFTCERLSPKYLRAPQAERERLERLEREKQTTV